MVGKDILRFTHSTANPALMLDIKLTWSLDCHGWFVMKDGKMSKSMVVYPEMLVERYD